MTSLLCSQLSQASDAEGPNDDTNFFELKALIDEHKRRKAIKASFRDVYLREVLRQSKSPSDALEKLVVCLKTYKELKCLEEHMDLKYFEKLARRYETSFLSLSPLVQGYRPSIDDDVKSY